MPIHKLREYPLQYPLIKIINCNYIEVSEVPRGNWVLAPARGSHSRDPTKLNELLELLLLLPELVPAAVVHPLAQELDGGLGTVTLQGWHVKVIYENYATLAQGGTHQATTAFF